MTTLEKINLWQAIFTGVAVLVAGVATYLAYKIGKKQNKINEIALSITNFVEIFLMPQQVILENELKERIIKWSILNKKCQLLSNILKRIQSQRAEKSRGEQCDTK